MTNQTENRFNGLIARWKNWKPLKRFLLAHRLSPG
jgi:hypothetical protein